MDGNGNYAYFSSTGPTADGRLKPNVVAQGQSSTVIDPNGGYVSSASGTSFSSPITAGMVACLWQANPEKSNIEIMEAIQESGSLANNPNQQLGFGIPDYFLANSILTVIESKAEDNLDMLVYPNPFNDELFVSIKDGSDDISSVELFDLTGKSLFYKDVNTSQGNRVKLSGAESLGAGIYFLQITVNNQVVKQKIIKN